MPYPTGSTTDGVDGPNGISVRDRWPQYRPKPSPSRFLRSVTAKRAKKRRTDDGLSEPVRKLVR